MSDKPHGNTGNRSAAKPASERADCSTAVRSTRAEREAWDAAAEAQGVKLSQWARDALNRAAGL